MPSLLSRLAKKCKRHPHLIHTIKIWWDNAQEELLDESYEPKLKLMETLCKEVEESWELPNWLPKITQRALWYWHVLAKDQALPKPSHKGRTGRREGTAYINMQKVGCALIQKVREARQSIPAGFMRREPAPSSHLTLIMLAELLRDLSRPISREDSDGVGLDIGLILAAEGDLAKKTAFSQG